MGVWLSTDPAEQFFNPYGYHTNPILFVDPNGETFVQLLAQIGIGMATSALQYAANPNNYGDNFGEVLDMLYYEEHSQVVLNMVQIVFLAIFCQQFQQTTLHYLYL